MSEQHMTAAETRARGGTGHPVAVADRATLEAQVLEEVSAALREAIGEDYVFDMEITAGTKFDQDLEMESIEFVNFAERIQQLYGDRVDFVRLLAGSRFEEIRAMRVGDLVSYIADSLTASAAGRVVAHG